MKIKSVASRLKAARDHVFADDSFKHVVKGLDDRLKEILRRAGDKLHALRCPTRPIDNGTDYEKRRNKRIGEPLQISDAEAFLTEVWSVQR